MRIALFTDTYYHINGVSMVYRRFARWCAARGIELEIFTPGSRPLEKIGSVSIHSVEMITPVPYYRDLYFDAFPLRPKIDRYVRQHDFDLAHVATQGHMALVGLRAAGAADLPKISCYHTKMPEYAASRFLRFFGDNPLGRRMAGVAEDMSWWYQRRLYRSSQLILVPTSSARKILEDKVGVPTAVFSRGVDSEAFSPDHRTRDGGDHRTRSLFVGRLSIEKNLDLLAKLDLPGGRGLYLVGDGPYKNVLQKRLPGAAFLGFLQGENLARAYASADVFVFPSKTETFGNAVLEAMASGLPVIVSNEGGPKDFVVDGETGFVTSSDEEFLERHRQLAGDAGLRKRLGANAREYAKTCNWDSIFEKQVLDNYRKVIEEWRTSGRS
ncbi:MAG TPA: glycosyltransferase family 1 protein [Acidobacteriota bacterium]|nr:glycosyltransferase family 1 protein [Acidobacteriota bacterium]